MDKKRIYLMLGLLGFTVTQALSQFTSISGTVNIYTTIDSIYSFNNNDVDSLIVSSTDGFGEGDTVMVYCVQGAEIETTDIYGEDQIGRDAQYPRNTGKYALLIIDEIDEPRKLVVLNTTIRRDDEIKPMEEGEVAQLIRVPSYRNAQVEAQGLTADAWNGSTGGVVALFVHGVLRLNGDIDVTGQGFRGASETVNYLGECSSEDTVLYGDNFYHIDNALAGKKGEGTTITTFDLLRGKARNINGGGGGNALLSGGGGGSNYTSGGNGGNESSFCEPGVSSPGGRGGFDLSRIGAYYINGNSFNRGNRIFLGGGGGTGTRISGLTTTDGGNGGGLVVIVADSIEGNGNWIIADGEDVTATATGAGGGGGGGGGIILDVMGYKTTLNLSAVGGKGGDTNHPTDTTGPGGGGGGGIYWLARTSQPGVNPDQFTNGASGENLTGGGINYGASDGVIPGKMNELIAPLRGFIFNTVPTEFTVCSDQLPDPILASPARGGDGPGSYTYQWVDSSATQQFWDIAPGVSNQQNYTIPGTLSDTTYFRRIVTSGILSPDTSFRIAVYVHPAITGNTIAAPDTVCSGNAPQLFVPSATIGGGPTGGTHTYSWLKDEGTGFVVADGDNTGATYQAPGLDISTSFSRITRSGVCTDTSEALFVQVWESLTGNDITPYDTVCFNTAPDLIGGAVPGAGDPDDKRYRWEYAPLNVGPWVEVTGATSQNYQPPALTQTTWYRRVALSGNGDACTDTSSAVEILNIPLITGNTITETQTVCTLDQPDLLTGSDPGGGYLSQYSYLWQSRTLSTGWVAADGINDVKSGYDAGIMDGDTTWFRRVVGSGGSARNVCLDASDSIAIHVLPSITNNVITTADPIKCQWELTDPVTQDLSGGATPGGGATQGGTDPTREYAWETASGTGSPGSWSTIGGEADIDYTGRPVLDSQEDRWFRRIVFSGPDRVCKDTTAPLLITVHTQITGNTIEPFDSVCFADTKLLTGNTPQGEPALTPVYTWRDLDGGEDIPGSDQEEFTTSPFNVLGEYHFERITSIGECTDTSNSMQVTVMQLPGGMLTDNSFIACEKDTVLIVDLNVESLQTYLVPWEVYLDNGVDAELVGPIMVTGDGPLPVTLDIDGDDLQYNFTLGEIIYRSPGGRYTCVSPVDSISGTVPVQVFRKPAPQIIVDGDSLEVFKVCDTTVDLVADADNGTSSWSSDPAGTLFISSGAGPDEYLISIPNDPQAYGVYNLMFTSVAGDCYDTDSIELRFFEQPDPAEAGPERIEVFVTDQVQLIADPPSAGYGFWELVDGSGTLVDPDSSSTSVYGLREEEENTFRWTVWNGDEYPGECVTTMDVTIVHHNKMKTYNGFSPDNGDALNDYFIMQGIKYADEFTITFFNALGNTVRTITDENIGEMVVDPGLIIDLKEDEMVVWDGRANNGNLVPSGTYYYAVDFTFIPRDNEGNSTGTARKERLTGYVIVARD